MNKQEVIEEVKKLLKIEEQKGEVHISFCGKTAMIKVGEITSHYDFLTYLKPSIERQIKQEKLEAVVEKPKEPTPIKPVVKKGIFS